VDDVPQVRQKRTWAENEGAASPRPFEPLFTQKTQISKPRPDLSSRVEFRMSAAGSLPRAKSKGTCGAPILQAHDTSLPLALTQARSQAPHSLNTQLTLSG
jgi:hypothetical protein